MWRQLIIDSLIQPRVAARRVLAFEIGVGPLVQAAAAIICIGMVLGFAALRLSGGAVDPISAAVLEQPIVGAFVQFGLMAAVAVLTFRIGRAFGGQGGFWDAALVVVWLNGMTLVIQVVQLVVLALIPPLAGLITVATLFWLLWAYASFVTELHKFSSPAMVLGVVVLTVVILVFGLTLVAAILGVTPEGMS